MASSLDETSPPPSAFCCPISLELMTDPVTLSSGITYDRSSIQSRFAAGHLTCPVTRLPLLPYPFFIPNHTLLRIIRSWHHSHSCALSSPNSLPSSDTDHIRGIRMGHLCTGALFKLGLLNSTVPDQLLPYDEAPCLLISLISHYAINACQGNVLAERTCEDALATLSILPLSSHHLTCLSDPHILSCISHFLYSMHRPSRINSALLLTKLISQHPTQNHFLRNLPLESLSALTRGLAQILNQSNTSTFLAQDILHSLCLLCKSSRTIVSSFADASTETIVLVALEQLRHNSVYRGETIISEKALALLEIVASCAEGRDAIASHALTVPTIARFLERCVSEAAIGAAVVVLWKMCRYSSQERVRRQATEACVLSKLMLLVHASRLGSRGKKKAQALVRLLIAEAH